MFSKMKVLLVVLFASVLTACGGGGSPEVEAELGNSKSYSYVTASVDVVGDSISIGVNTEVSPIMRLTEYRPNWAVVHHSAGGLQLDTMIAGYSEPTPGAHPIYFPMGPQLPFPQVQRSSRYVVIALGVNDALNNSTMQEAVRFEHNMRYVIRTLVAENRVPVLTGVPNLAVNPAFLKHYNNVTLMLAQEYGLVHAGWGEAYGIEGVGSDGIHPHQGGSDMLAGRLIRAIDQAIELDNAGVYANIQMLAMK